MNFESPEYFLLLPAMVLAGWFWRGLRLHSPLRALIIILATVALASPHIRHQQNALDLYVLLDRSDSTEDLIDKHLPEWQRLLEKSKPGRNDNLRFINYAAEVAELGADGSSFTGSRGLTRTGLALSSVAAQADAKRPSRVLLFTDGYSTEPLQEAAAHLQERGIPLDYRLIRDEKENDFRVARMSFPERVQVGEPYLISLSLRGPVDASFPLILRRNGQTLTETTATLVNGLATVEFTDRIGKPGGYEYEAEIRPANDAHPGNNKASRWIEIRGGPRLILATRYKDDPLAKSLAAMNFTVETVMDPAKLHPGLLSGARAVVINNIPAYEVPADFLKSLDFFVREQGGGIMMAGGDRSFGSGGYFQSPRRCAAAGVDGTQVRAPQARGGPVHRHGPVGLDVGRSGWRENQDGSGQLRGRGCDWLVRSDGPGGGVRRGQRVHLHRRPHPDPRQEGRTDPEGPQDQIFGRGDFRV